MMKTPKDQNQLAHLVDQLSDYLAALNLDSDVSDFDFLVSGFESEIYTFRLQKNHYVLRLFTGDGAGEKLVRESDGLAFLQKSSYPVPGLLLYETDSSILGKPFEIVDRLEGQTLWSILAASEADQVRQLLSTFGKLLAQLHKLDWRAFTPNAEKIESAPLLLLDEIIAGYRSLYAQYSLSGFLQVTDWLDVHKHDISVRPAIVHQDFHANNVFVGLDNQMYVIDWTQFGISDYRIDLCWTLLIMGDFGNPEWGGEILKAYAADSNQPIEHLEYFHVIVYMKLLASTVIAYTYGPEKVGLRSEAATLPDEQLKIYKQIAQRLQLITGVAIAELARVLEKSE
jgi:aminoglycoside phosphotransferase (APT) family kinase protein